MKKLIGILMLTLLLPGCIFIVGAAAGGALVGAAYDHRKIEAVANDTKLNNKIVAKINANPTLRTDTHISVTVYNHTVLLTGQVLSADQRSEAEGAAHEVQDVEKVYNQITVQGPVSSLTHASDSWITTKIRTQMLATKGLKSSIIKVVTENGTVYLLGQVSHEQADIAVDIARKVAGVQRVMKIFDYTDPSA